MSAKKTAENVAEVVADKVVEAIVDTGYVSGVFVPKKVIVIGGAAVAGAVAFFVVKKIRKSRKSVTVEVTETPKFEPIS